MESTARCFAGGCGLEADHTLDGDACCSEHLLMCGSFIGWLGDEDGGWGFSVDLTGLDFDAERALYEKTLRRRAPRTG